LVKPRAIHPHRKCDRELQFLDPKYGLIPG
jgi:hypothetical protein